MDFSVAGSSNANNTDNAWNVNMNNGNVNNNNKSNDNHVWPVAGRDCSVCGSSLLSGCRECLFRMAPDACGTCSVLRDARLAHPLFRYETLYAAYRTCRRRKRKTHNALAFEVNLEEEVFRLGERLRSGRYQPGRSMVFLVEKPKRREIFAADFRDRVVHHLLVNSLEPEWEKRFAFDSYACRTGKGTHRAVERLRSFCRKATKNNSRNAYYLQLDIRGFFMNIDRRILYRRLERFENDPVRLELVRKLVFHDSTRMCVFKGCSEADCRALPPHKSLFHAKESCGLPIGNLTSQFFANVYLDALDQFIKRTLRVKHYVRYCDDFVLLHESRRQLEEWEAEIEAFLGKELRLELNPKRRLRRVSDGIDFLGYIVRPDYLLVRRRAVNALRQRLDSIQTKLPAGRLVFPEYEMEKAFAWLQSYHGHFGHAASRRLMDALLLRYPFIRQWFSGEGPFRCRYPDPAEIRFDRQVEWYREMFPDAALAIQRGRCFEVFSKNPGTPPKVWIGQGSVHNGFIYERRLAEIGLTGGDR